MDRNPQRTRHAPCSYTIGGLAHPQNGSGGKASEAEERGKGPQYSRGALLPPFPHGFTPSQPACPLPPPQPQHITRICKHIDTRTENNPEKLTQRNTETHT